MQAIILFKNLDFFPTKSQNDAWQPPKPLKLNIFEFIYCGCQLLTRKCHRTKFFARLAARLIIIINVCECCDYIKMLMQWTSITVINILTMFVYCIISDHTDSTVIQATNNVNACMRCAYLFFNFPLACTHGKVYILLTV